MKTNDYSDLVAGYLTGTLSEAERATFEQQLATDPALVEALAAGRLLERELRRQRPDIRALVEEANAAHPYIPEEPPHNGGSSPRSRWPWWIGLLLIVAVTTWFFLPRGEPASRATDQSVKPMPNGQPGSVVPTDTLEKAGSPPTLPDEAPPASTPSPPQAQQTAPTAAPPDQFAEIRQLALTEYTKEPYEPDVTLSATGTPEDSLERARLAWSREDWQGVREWVPATGQTADRMRTHAAFRAGDFAAAASGFRRLSEKPFIGYAADWYYLLSLAAQLPGTREAFDQQLEKVSAPGHPYRQRTTVFK